MEKETGTDREYKIIGIKKQFVSEKIVRFVNRKLFILYIFDTIFPI